MREILHFFPFVIVPLEVLVRVLQAQAVKGIAEIF